MSLSEMANARKSELTTSTTAVVRAEGINPPDAAYYPPKVQAETTATPAPSAAETTSTPAPAAPKTLSLFVGSMPTKVPGGFQYLNLSDEIARRAAVIAEKYKVTDVRLVKYAEGTNALLATFQTDRLYGNVVARPGGLANAVIEILEAQADVVVHPLG